MNRKTPAIWVENSLDLTAPPHIYLAGRIDPQQLKRELRGEQLVRPRSPLAPAPNRELPPQSPQSLRSLFKIAKTDMASLGFDPDKFYLYVLYQSGKVEPNLALREPQWHFDFMRNLRHTDRPGYFPVTIGYSVSSGFPTSFATKLTAADGAPLPARETISRVQDHDELGQSAEKSGNIFQPAPGDVIRYDSLVLHRGTKNTGEQPIHRVFLHLAFSPVP